MFQERGESLTSGLTVQAPIDFNGSSDYIEIPADREWHFISYYNGITDIVIHNRALREDDISNACSLFGGYADRALSKEESEIIHELLVNHSEIKSWLIRNNILYLEIDEET